MPASESCTRLSCKLFPLSLYEALEVDTIGLLSLNQVILGDGDPLASHLSSTEPCSREATVVVSLDDQTVGGAIIKKRKLYFEQHLYVNLTCSCVKNKFYNSWFLLLNNPLTVEWRLNDFVLHPFPV